ncbi:MAG: trypsin-like peptidase domain-containing protein [Aggregatilineales bacterium]
MKAFVLCCVLALAACRPSTALFPRATPVGSAADLPVAIAAPTQPPILPTPVSTEVIAVADAEYLLLSNIYERSAPSVVSVEVRTATGDLTRGSGFVLDRAGHIVTNAHVVANAREVRVVFHEGDTDEARLIGVDPFSDLAVIKVPSDGLRLRPLPIGDSATIRVGQRAIAIGNPFGLNASMSVGIISGVGRTLFSAALIERTALAGYQNPSIIQFDAPINPGSSGGPLLNSEGLVVGVTTAIRTDSGVFAGVGFAVPSQTLKRVVPQLIQTGRAEYPWLGLSVSPEENGYSVTALAETLNLPVRQGVLVRGVTVGSPAEVAGLRGGTAVVEVRGQAVCVGGDIIVAVNGQPIASMNDLSAYLIENTRVGDTVTLRVVRHQQVFDVPVRLTARPATAGPVRDCAG